MNLPPLITQLKIIRAVGDKWSTLPVETPKSPIPGVPSEALSPTLLKQILPNPSRPVVDMESGIEVLACAANAINHSLIDLSEAPEILRAAIEAAVLYDRALNEGTATDQHVQALIEAASKIDFTRFSSEN